MRILLVDDTGKDLEVLRDALLETGNAIVGECTDAITLLAMVGETQPDIVIIDSDSPTRDVLEQLFVVSRDNPHSLEAHVLGLGMTIAGDFEVNGQPFATVVFRLPEPKLGENS